jgi:hypothetical protein
MAMNTGILFQPCLDLEMITHTTVVQNHTDRQTFGHFTVNLPQKLSEFDIARCPG